MSQSLPVDNFEWMSGRDVQTFDVTAIADDVEIGYLLEIDLEYCKELHGLHSDYPLAPERMVITDGMLASYQQELKVELGYKLAKVAKLTPNLWDKTKYVLHYRNLKFYLAQGLKLLKIHSILKFKQAPWLKPYIELNTRLRPAATNEFEKESF